MGAVLDLLLASTSPRRRELLAAAGLTFALCEPGPEYLRGGDHDHGERGEPLALAQERARRKALGARPVTMGVPVLGVDTVVDLEGEELGKARDRREAEAMLLRLAGRRHLVHTAHCLHWGDGRMREHLASAAVACRAPTAEELSRYLDSEEWRGKAGGYGIQDPSQSFLQLAEGAFDTVVGLHVAAVRAMLLAGPPGGGP